MRSCSITVFVGSLIAWAQDVWFYDERLSSGPIMVRKGVKCVNLPKKNSAPKWGQALSCETFPSTLRIIEKSILPKWRGSGGGEGEEKKERMWPQWRFHKGDGPKDAEKKIRMGLCCCCCCCYHNQYNSHKYNSQLLLLGDFLRNPLIVMRACKKRRASEKGRHRGLNTPDLQWSPGSQPHLCFEL